MSNTKYETQNTKYQTQILKQASFNAGKAATTMPKSAIGRQSPSNPPSASITVIWRIFFETSAGSPETICAALLLLALRARAQVELWRDTRTLFESALQVAPRAPFVLATLGNAALEDGRLDDAIALYRQALQVDPDDARVQANLGVAWATRGDLGAAVAVLEGASRAAPKAGPTSAPAA